MNNIVYLNGAYLPRAEARLPVDDRGFIFGDGVYEVTRVVDGRLVASDRHMRRLQRGLRALQLTPEESLADIEAISVRVLAENGLADGEGTVYLQITRGVAPRTHHFPPPDTRCTVFVSASRLQPPHAEREAGVAVTTYPDIRWSRCDIKTVNLIPAVLAKQHAKSSGVFESIFVRDGAITEGSHTNCFGVIDGEVRTYPACNYILSGVTRDLVLEVAREKRMRVSETPLYQSDLALLDEFFLTGTTTDVMPVTAIDGMPVGSGQPGPITMSLYEGLAARIYGKAGAVHV
jgi:D-alanine transaminase